jgi:predicted molibdopterin-dependent oxidoreductase YjgC
MHHVLALCSGMRRRRSVDVCNPSRRTRFDSRISTFEEVPIPESTCVYCGNCVQACPTGALKAKRAAWLEQGLDLKQLARVSNLDRREKG